METDTYILTLDPDGGFIKYPFTEQDARHPEETHSVDKYTTKPRTFSVTVGQQVTGFPPDVKRPGYTFKGWYRTFPGFHSSGAEKQTRLTPSTIWNWNSDLTFTARWKPQNCTITWDGNGGKWDNETKRTIATTYGTIVGSMDEFKNDLPSISEHNFIGWFTHPKHGNQIMEYSQVDGNRTYYAHWEEIPKFLVTFDANGGSGGWSIYMLIDSEIVAPDVNLEGHTFMGWKPEVDAFVPSHDVTYVAQWLPNKYTVTFNPNGGSVSSESRLVTYNTPIGSLPTPTRTGYESIGWWTSMEGGTQISSDVRITKPETYYAHWNIRQFAATFNANGGTGGTTKTQNYGTTLAAPTVTKVGHTFMGWNPSVPRTMPAEDTTYVAQWQINEYTITFNANGGIGGYTTTKEYNSPLSAPNVTKNGYTLSGWNPPVPITVIASETYYAQWTPNQYTITFDANGGTNGWSELRPYGSEITPPTVKKLGYRFNGWLPEVDETVPIGGARYVAQWIEETQTIYHTVTFVVDSEKGEVTSGNLNQQVEDGHSADGPTVQAKAGWTFTGWDKSYNNIVADTTITAQFEEEEQPEPEEGFMLLYEDGSPILTEDGQSHIMWESTHHVVTFIVDSTKATTTGDLIQQVEDGHSATEPTVQAKSGWRFNGWDKTFTNIVTDITIKAQFEEVVDVGPYTVTFVVDTTKGTVYAQNLIQQVERNHEAIAPIVYPKSDWVFDGWDKEFDNVVSDMTITAQFRKSYTVTYIVDSTKGIVTSDNLIQKVGEGGSATQPTVYAKSGIWFQGWDKTSSNISQNTTITAIFTNPTPESTVYTHILFQPDGGNMDNLERDFPSGPLGSNIPVPTRYGYNFNYWRIHGHGTILSPSTQVYPEELTYHAWAVWYPITYYIKYNANDSGDATGTMPDQEMIYSVEAKLASNNFTRPTWVFIGWATTPDGDVRYAGNATVVNLKNEQDAIFNLYAKWNRDRYAIRFDSNGGTGIMTNQTITFGETVNLNPCTFTRSGYDFIGWARSSTGDVEFRDQQAVIDLGKDVVLYAQWRKQAER